MLKDIGNLFSSRRKLGDRVSHRQTCFYGTITAIEFLNGVELITVKLDRGGEMKKIDRREFMTIGSRECQDQDVRQINRTAQEYLNHLDYSQGFSSESILDEIERGY